MKNDVEQRTVNLHFAVVVNKAQLPEPVHKKVNPGAGCAHHFRQSFLTYFWNDLVRLPFFAEPGQEQKGPRQPLFAGVEKLINQVRLVADVSA